MLDNNELLLVFVDILINYELRRGYILFCLDYKFFDL